MACYWSNPAIREFRACLPSSTTDLAPLSRASWSVIGSFSQAVACYWSNPGNNSELVCPVVSQLWLHLHVLPDQLHYSQMVAGYWSTPRPIACYWSTPGQEFLASQPFRTTARVPDSSASWPVIGSFLLPGTLLLVHFCQTRIPFCKQVSLQLTKT